MDSVVILLQWRRELQNSLISYLISVVPMADVATDRGSNGANVTVLYNSLYKISVVADLCGRINDTTMIRVYYGKFEEKFSTYHYYFCVCYCHLRNS